MSLANISNEKLIQGMIKSFENGSSLLDEAFILKESGKFPRAYTLTQLAIEEHDRAYHHMRLDACS